MLLTTLCDPTLHELRDTLTQQDFQALHQLLQKHLNQSVEECWSLRPPLALRDLKSGAPAR
jgi:hypothetical protein